jgi:quercetin dioxygenase-like cupin family protein
VKLLLALSSAALLFCAQDPRVPIENDQVKVIRALEQPHQKTKLHKHDVNRVMIYLQAGTQDFNYQDGEKKTLQFKAGEALWSPAGKMHIAEITSPQTVTLVEVELKKPGSGAKTLPNPLDPVKIDPKHYRVAFENDQVRVLRVSIGAHESAPMHNHALNRVVVYLTDQKVRVKSPTGKIDVTEHKAGDIAWAGPAQHSEENLNGVPFELYAVEIKN